MQSRSSRHYTTGVLLLAVLGFVGCAVGTSVTGDGGSPSDGGPKDGGSQNKDSGTQDSGTQNKDSGSQGYDSGTQQLDSGSPCGTCQGNTVCCGSKCVDTTKDSNNCGSCGNVCTGQTCCNSACTNTTSDINNCGACGNTCGSGMTCVNSTCQGSTTCTIDKSTCAHSPCTTGVALGPFCDLTDEGIVYFVCLDYPSCCSTTWDATCVSDAASYETNSCIGSGC